MQDADFLKMIKKTTNRLGIIGFFILAFGAFMVWLFLSGVDPDAQNMSTAGKVTGMVFAGIFILVGLLMLVLAIRAATKIRQGKHPLVNDIKNNEQSYILWYYEHITHVKSGPAKNTAHNIWLMGRDKKHYSINVKKSKVEDTFTYLASKFPNALVGYSKELEAAYEQKVKELNR